MICGYNFSQKLKSKLFQLEGYRNQIMHSEIFFNEDDIISLFDGLLDELDIVFFNAIGKDYKTLSGYSSLKNSFEKFEEYLVKNNMGLKGKVIQCFLDIFENIKLGMGSNEVKRITDIDKVNTIFKKLFAHDFKFGTDLYNKFCSGDISEIKRIGKNHFSIVSRDTMAEYHIKFRSLILYIPKIYENTSPLIFIECDTDSVEEQFKENLIKDYSNIQYLKGIHLVEENKTKFDVDFVNNFYNNSNSDDYTPLPEHLSIYKFITKGVFCFLNVQSLHYGRITKILDDYKFTDGKEFEVTLRNGVEKI